MKRKRPQKIALLVASESSVWGSCKSITANLSRTYDLLPGDFEVHRIPVSSDELNLDLEVGTGYLQKIARQLHSIRPDRIVFISQNLDPGKIIFALRAYDPQFFLRVSYVIHVYGDFTLFWRQWIQAELVFQDLSLLLVCASERQSGVVRYFLPEEGAGAVATCPFPVDTAHFAFQPQARSEGRKRLGLRDSQQLLLYTGRISLQKNVHTLVEEFASLLRKTDRDVVLGVAGNFDDIGGPTIGLRLQVGYYFQKMQGILRGLPAAARERIRWLGHTGFAELPSLYAAADAYASLSLYHDEDFGMAPGEALATGLPCVLSSWGGYACFGVPGTDIGFIGVDLDKQGVRLRREEIVDAMAKSLSLGKSAFERKAAGDAFAARFSFESVASTLADLLRQPTDLGFSGFHWRLGYMDQKQKMNSSFYQELYRHYTGAE